MWGIFSKSVNLQSPKVIINVVRNKAIILGKDPITAKSLEQILKEKNYKDENIYFKVDIGLSTPLKSRKKSLEEMRVLNSLKKSSELEKAARTLTLKIPTEDVQAEWIKEKRSDHLKIAANHYGIFDDLFGDAYFTPHVHLDIAYEQKDGMEAPVHRGNVIKPAEATSQPLVQFKSEPDDLWTLILTNPDGDLTKNNSECIHWFVGNIPGGDLSKGEVIYDYLRPFPPRGIGFQRLVFVLFKQEKEMDYSNLKKPSPCLLLALRSFETLEFYRERQDDLTPMGLGFYQCDWDRSVSKTFHNILNMEEPIYEYDHEPRHIKRQTHFPNKQPFNMYLNKYRDPKDIAKEYLVKKLLKENPLEPPKKPNLYQHIYSVDRSKVKPWQTDEEVRTTFGLGYVSLLKDDDYDFPK